jgi:hypothetical protein
MSDLLLALFEAIAVAAHFEDVDVMGQPVEQRAGERLGPNTPVSLLRRRFALQGLCSSGIVLGASVSRRTCGSRGKNIGLTVERCDQTVDAAILQDGGEF